MESEMSLFLNLTLEQGFNISTSFCVHIEYHLATENSIYMEVHSFVNRSEMSIFAHAQI